MSLMRAMIPAITLAAGAAVATAQQPGIELRLETRTLELGEAIDVQLVCTNTGKPGLPEAAIPDGLDLKLLNPNPASSSFTQIINGRMTQRITFTYTLRLTALREGSHELGPIKVVADGRTYETEPVQITVRNTDVASASKGDRYIFAELEVQPRSLYVTEKFRATLTFGIRKVEIGRRRIDVDLLREVLDVRGSQLSVFAGERARTSERWLTDSSGARHRYQVFTVTKQIRAEEVGTMAVGPVFLKANYPTAVRRGFFGGFEITQYRRETARADAVTVEIKAPPEEGRPADYTGAIGRFTMSVRAKPTHVEQGQPITLTVVIQGSPLEGVAGPDLGHQPELASRFDYVSDELVGDVEAGRKVFRRAIFPKQVGEQTIPAISWSFFDPRQERYITLVSDPIDITVEAPAPGTSPRITLLDQPQPAGNGTTLTLLGGGISPNFLDVDAVLADQSFTLSAPWAASLVVSPMAWLVVTLTARHRMRLKSDIHFARRRRARRHAHARISRALRNGEPIQQLCGLTEAMTGYLSDRYGLPSGTLTPAEVRSLLASNGLDEATAGKIADFLESCDAVRYAPGAEGSLPPKHAAAQVRGWIKQIEKSTR